MIVADSNLIAYLLIPGKHNELADAIYAKDADWAVPLICRSEIRNILALYMRHEGMSLLQSSKTMEHAENLWKDREFAVPSDAVLELCFRHKVTAYDAEFVVLAGQLDCPLITFDQVILKAFPGRAMSAHDFLTN